MARSSKKLNLKNIGARTEGMLLEIGVDGYESLNRIGSVEAYRRLRGALSGEGEFKRSIRLGSRLMGDPLARTAAGGQGSAHREVGRPGITRHNVTRRGPWLPKPRSRKLFGRSRLSARDYEQRPPSPIRRHDKIRDRLFRLRRRKGRI